jgi:hypothetical protein
MGVERERKRERAEWGGGGQESKVSAGSAPDLIHGTKMLGKHRSQRKLMRKFSHPRARFNDGHEPPN